MQTILWKTQEIRPLICEEFFPFHFCSDVFLTSAHNLNEFWNIWNSSQTFWNRHEMFVNISTPSWCRPSIQSAGIMKGSSSCAVTQTAAWPCGTSETPPSHSRSPSLTVRRQNQSMLFKKWLNRLKLWWSQAWKTESLYRWVI